MTKEVKVVEIEKEFDQLFADIDALTDNLYQGNSYAMSQVLDAYKESKEQY